MNDTPLELGRIDDAAAIRAERDALLAEIERQKRRYNRLRQYARAWLSTLHSANYAVDELTRVRPPDMEVMP